MDYETTDDVLNRLVAESAELAKALRELSLASNNYIGAISLDPESRLPSTDAAGNRYDRANAAARTILARLDKSQ